MPSRHSLSRDKAGVQKTATKVRRNRSYNPASDDSYYQNNEDMSPDDSFSQDDVYSAQNYQFLLQNYTELYNILVQPNMELQQKLKTQIQKNATALEQMKQLSSQQQDNIQQLRQVVQGQVGSPGPLVQRLLKNLQQQQQNVKIKETQNMVASMLKSSSSRELQIQDLQSSLTGLQDIERKLNLYNNNILAMNVLTGIFIAPGSNAQQAVKYINDTRMPGETQSFVFSIGSVANRRNYVGQLVIRDDGLYDVKCLRKPSGQVVADYERDYEGLDGDSVKLLVQQFVSQYVEQ